MDAEDIHPYFVPSTDFWSVIFLNSGESRSFSSIFPCLGACYTFNSGSATSSRQYPTVGLFPIFRVVLSFEVAPLSEDETRMPGLVPEMLLGYIDIW